jgi:hypothetical protein
LGYQLLLLDLLSQVTLVEQYGMWVAWELCLCAFDQAIPPIFSRVFGPTWDHAGDCGPLVSQYLLLLHQHQFFFKTPVAFQKGWVQMIEPPFPTLPRLAILLAVPKRIVQMLRDHCPLLLPKRGDKCCKHLIFL